VDDDVTDGDPAEGADDISVLVADDEELFRRGLRTVLQLEAGFSVSEAADGAAAVEQATALAPDVVLMDVRMPNMGGIEAAGASARSPQPAGSSCSRRATTTTTCSGRCGRGPTATS